MAHTFSMKDAAEQLAKLPEMLAHEGEAPVAAVVRRGRPVLAVLPWDLYVGLLQTLASLPEDAANPQRDGIRALLSDATETMSAETPGEKPQNRSSHQPHRRRPNR